MYSPQGTAKRKLAIIGKGLTFDSGGLNLKVGGLGIEMMKIDMDGADRLQRQMWIRDSLMTTASS